MGFGSYAVPVVNVSAAIHERARPARLPQWHRAIGDNGLKIIRFFNYLEFSQVFGFPGQDGPEIAFPRMDALTYLAITA